MVHKQYFAIFMLMLCTVSSHTLGFLGKKKSTSQHLKEYPKNNPKKTAAFLGTAACAAYCSLYAWNKGANELGAHLVENVIGQGIVNPTISFMRYYDILLRVYKGQKLPLNGFNLNPYIATPAAVFGATAHVIGAYVLIKKGIEWHNGK